MPEMSRIEQLQDEIEELEKQVLPLTAITSRYVGSGEDGFTDPEVEEAHNKVMPLLEQLEAKRRELAKLERDDPFSGIVGVTKGE